MPTLEEVTRSGMCIGCGACVAADDSLQLSIHPKTLSFAPNGNGNNDAQRVCPAIAVDYSGLTAMRFPAAEAGSCGVISSVKLAQSTTLERNKKASSGGLIKELLLELITEQNVSGIIAISKAEGIAYEPKFITSAEEIEALPGSIYHCISYEKAYPLLLDAPKKVVIVGLPCQLEGLYAFINTVRPDLLCKIHTTIGLICGWQYSLHAIKAFCQYNNLIYEDLLNITYRGGDSLGRMCLQFSDGELCVNRKKNIFYLAAFDRSYNLHRCHVCVNHTNFLSDIAVGDAWLKRTRKTTTGVSLVIARNTHAEQLLKTLIGKKAIVTVPGTESDIIESQSRNLVFGDAAYSYAHFLHNSGQHAPILCASNKKNAKLIPKRFVASFARQLRLKQSLQANGSYRTLLIKKLLCEFPILACKSLFRRANEKTAQENNPFHQASIFPSAFR